MNYYGNVSCVLRRVTKLRGFTMDLAVHRPATATAYIHTPRVYWREQVTRVICGKQGSRALLAETTDLAKVSQYGREDPHTAVRRLLHSTRVFPPSVG